MCAQVQDDIAQVLQLRSPARLLSSFNRPNISYSVRYQLSGSKPPVDQIAQLIGSCLPMQMLSFPHLPCMHACRGELKIGITAATRCEATAEAA